MLTSESVLLELQEPLVQCVLILLRCTTLLLLNHFAADLRTMPLHECLREAPFSIAERAYTLFYGAFMKLAVLFAQQANSHGCVVSAAWDAGPLRHT